MAALGPLRVQEGQMGIERALPSPEEIRADAAADLANKLAAVSRPTNDLLERYALPDERHDGGIAVLAAQIAFILQPFRTREQLRIDCRGPLFASPQQAGTTRAGQELRTPAAW